MRKIEAKMLQAIHRGNDFKLDNTEVINLGDVRFVYLHGNLIATVTRDEVTVEDAGWQTTTTKSRLNAILRGFTLGFGIYQKDFEWYLAGPDGSVAWEYEHVLPNASTDWKFWQTVHAVAC